MDKTTNGGIIMANLTEEDINLNCDFYRHGTTYIKLGTISTSTGDKVNGQFLMLKECDGTYHVITKHKLKRCKVKQQQMVKNDI